VALASTYQDDWGGGIYRGRRAPANAVYDAVNALVNDEGQLFKRGGSSYKTTSDATNTLNYLWDGQMTPGRRTVFYSDRLYTLDTDDHTPLMVSSVVPATVGCPVEVDGWLIFPDTSGGLAIVAYAGSRKTANYATGTVTVTAGSTTVTGVGSSWLANVDSGMTFNSGPSTQWAIVQSVDSNTQLKLRDPWPYATAAGVAYNAFRAPSLTIDIPSNPLTGLVAGAVARRLLLGLASKVYFSPRGTPLDMANGLTTNFHVIPDGSTVTGIRSLGDSAIVFSSSGIWSIDNMSLDAVDDYGNVQQTISRISGEVLLWGDGGIAAWGGALLVPAVDDVWIVGPGAPPISASDEIRPLYRSYVKAGYQPGMAMVHRGHYFLPVMNGSTVVDVLVCRLDRGFAWTRWSGHAAGAAYAQRIGATTRAPKLFGLNGLRVTDLTDTFDPTSSNTADADATTPSCTIITRDYPTSQQRAFVQRIRARYELTGTGSPTVTAEYTSDQDAGTFATITDKGEQSGAAGWGKSDGSLYQWARVGKKRERIRFRFTQAGAATSFVWRSFEMLTRPPGRQ
jgi:hypothetical protein